MTQDVKNEACYAVKIRVCGDVHIVMLDGSLESMQEQVGGYIQAVTATYIPTSDPFVLVVDEEGKIKERPVNYLATAIYGKPYGYIAGDVLLMPKALGCVDYATAEIHAALVKAVDTALRKGVFPEWKKILDKVGESK